MYACITILVTDILLFTSQCSSLRTYSTCCHTLVCILFYQTGDWLIQKYTTSWSTLVLEDHGTITVEEGQTFSACQRILITTQIWYIEEKDNPLVKFMEQNMNGLLIWPTIITTFLVLSVRSPQEPLSWWSLPNFRVPLPEQENTMAILWQKVNTIIVQHLSVWTEKWSILLEGLEIQMGFYSTTQKYDVTKAFLALHMWTTKNWTV